MPQPFIGRQRELDRLAAIARGVGDGGAACAFVRGPPGVGKSSLARHLLATLARDGWQVAAAGAWEFGGAPPFWPWSDALRHLGAHAASEELKQRGHEGAPSRDARAAILMRIGDALAEIGRRDRVAVLIDDLHAADAATIALLRFVAQHRRPSRVLVLGTWRSVEHDAPPEVLDELAELARQGHTLDLEVFDRGELAELLVANGAERSESAVENLAAATGGLPLLAAEVARGGDGGERASGVRAWLERKLARLAPETRTLLSWAALLGRPAAPRFLAHVAGLDDAIAMRALDEAHSSRLAIIAGRPPEVTLAHGLVRETAVAALKPSERARMHARLATSLEALYQVTELGPHLAELARHFVAGASELGHARAAAVAAKSGHEALRRTAFEDARAAYDVAIRLVLGAAEDDRGSIARWRAALGECAWLTGDRVAAVGAFRLAIAEAKAVGDLTARVRAALAWGRTVEYLSRDLEVEGALAALLDDLPASELRARAEVATMLAIRLWTAPHAVERKAELIALADAAARELGDAARIAGVIAARLQTCPGGTAPATRLGWSNEAVALAERSGDDEAMLEALRFRGSILIELGQVERAAADIEAFAALAAKLGWPSARITAASRLGLLAALRGDLATAARHADEARRIGNELGDQGAELLHAAVMSVLHERAGDHAALASDLDGVAPRMGAIPFLRARVAAGRALLGDAAEARRLLAPLLPPPPGDDLLRGAMLGWTAEALHRLGDREHAAAVREALLPFAGRLLTAGGAIALGQADRFIALCDSLQEHRSLERASALSGPARDAWLVARGDVWAVGLGAAHALVKHQKGLEYLRQLIARPRQPVPALELAGAGELREGRDQVLDAAALGALKARVRSLKDTLAEAEADRDLGRAEKARDELEALTEELRRSLGTGGKARLQTGASERARMAVTQALRRAIQALAKVDAALAEHLDRSVKSGAVVIFDPPAEPKINWHL